MRTCLILLVAATGVAAAEPPRTTPACTRTADHVIETVVGPTADPAHRPLRDLVAHRCEQDHWPVAAQACVLAATHDQDTVACVAKLAKVQQTALDGDLDRLADGVSTRGPTRGAAIRLSRALHPTRSTRPLAMGPMVTVGVATDTNEVVFVRALHEQGNAAYRAGKYDLAARKFAAALDADPAPELMYHLAQAYRLKGDHRRAVELYEAYLDASPDGAAAADCRAQLERLRDQLP